MAHVVDPSPKAPVGPQLVEGYLILRVLVLGDPMVPHGHGSPRVMAEDQVTKSSVKLMSFFWHTECLLGVTY